MRATRQPEKTSHRRLRGIFFDLDDTLISYTAAERNALVAGCRLAQQMDPNLNERTLAATILEVYVREFAYGTPGFTRLSSLSVTDFRMQLTGKALERCGVNDPALVGTLVDAYALAERAALHAFPLVAETLRRLRPHFRLGVITNGPSAMQREKLAVLALEGWFDEIVVDTEFGHPKPDPRIFEHAARRVDLEPQELMFVGNSLDADVAGAVGAGWTSVWAREEGASSPDPTLPHPDYIVSSIATLLDLPPVAAVLRELRPAALVSFGDLPPRSVTA